MRCRTVHLFPILLALALTLGTGELASARPTTPAGKPMVLSRETVGTNTNTLPAAPWHTIVVTPAPRTPKIHLCDKLNPVWWLENADDTTPPAWYLPNDRHRLTKWRFRNPFHNFDHYVIGVADKSFHRSGHYPERNSDPHGGWDLEVGRYTVILLPFVSYERSWCFFYLGWREHGAFGAELIFHRKAKG